MQDIKKALKKIYLRNHQRNGTANRFIKSTSEPVIGHKNFRRNQGGPQIRKRFYKSCSKPGHWRSEWFKLKKTLASKKKSPKTENSSMQTYDNVGSHFMGSGGRHNRKHYFQKLDRHKTALIDTGPWQSLIGQNNLETLMNDLNMKRLKNVSNGNISQI